MKRIAARISRRAVRLCQRLMLDLDVVRRGDVPEGPKVFAFNHPSTTDPVWMLGVVSDDMSILITEMCFDVPVVGAYLRSAGHIPVVDGNGRAAFEEARRRLAAGENVGIFPEGALSPVEGGVGRAKTGAVRLALAAGASIVPVGIGLEPERLRAVETTVGDKTETARYYLGGAYCVTVGEPIRLTGSVEDRDLVVRESERLMRTLGELAAQSERRVAAKVASRGRLASWPARLARAS